MFQRYHDLTVALLSGFLLGSLNKVWPWKEVLDSYTKHAGTPKEEIIPTLERNLTPGMFEAMGSGDPHTAAALLLALAGMVLILGLEWLGNQQKTGRA